MKTVLEAGKHYIECNDLSTLQDAFLHLDLGSSGIDGAWLFQKLYLHACLKGRREIAEWLQNTVFPTLDPIAQIALRQGFAYGRHLLKTAEKLGTNDQHNWAS